MAGKESFTNTRLPIIGGITAAIGASLCCVGPFLLLSLGISGAWIGNLTVLGSWGFSVLKRHNPLQPPWLLASSGVLTSS